MEYLLRKSLHLLLVMCICALPLAAVAQNPDLFEREQQKPPTELEELLGEAPEEVLPAPKAPTTIEEFANQFYKNCIRQKHPKLEGKSLEALCACTSANFPENMTLKQAYEMQRTTEEGRLQRVRYKEFVYIPCLRYPTSILVEGRCLEDETIKRKYRNYKMVCNCTGEKMGDYMDSKAPSYNRVSMYRDMSSLDPMIHLLDSKPFNDHTARSMRYCVDRYEYGKQ